MREERPHVDLRVNLQLQLHFHSYEFLALNLILGDSSPVDVKRNFTDHQHLLYLAQYRDLEPGVGVRSYVFCFLIFFLIMILFYLIFEAGLLNLIFFFPP